MKHLLKHSLILLVVISFLTTTKAQQNEIKAISFTDEIKQEVINNLKQELKNNYISVNYISHIEQNLDNFTKEENFKTIKNPDQFAEELTSVINSGIQDNHLNIRYNYNSTKEISFAETTENQQNNQNKHISNRIRKPRKIEKPIEFKKLENDILYLKLGIFVDSPYFYNKIDEALDLTKNCKAVIIDLRNCIGGAQEAENYVISYFLKNNTQLSSIYKREGEKVSEEKFYASAKVKGDRLLDTSLYILTGKNTSFTAENFTYDLQLLQRAKVIGEKTKGVAHSVQEFSLNHDFYAFISTGKSYNHITKTNWEKVGIEPDIFIVENDALERAILDASN